MERILIAKKPFILNRYKLKKGDKLDFGSFPDTIYYDINYDTTIDRSGVVMLSCYDEKSGQGVFLPINVEDKYTLYNDMAYNDSWSDKVEKAMTPKN